LSAAHAQHLEGKNDRETGDALPSDVMADEMVLTTLYIMTTNIPMKEGVAASVIICRFFGIEHALS
jgi:hypothetical protein